jgi:hypothetical protein
MFSAGRRDLECWCIDNQDCVVRMGFCRGHDSALLNVTAKHQGVNLKVGAGMSPLRGFIACFGSL